MIQTPTIVTALFNIGRDTWDNYQQGYDTYLNWMTSLLMYDTKMVIYTDDILYETILNKRKVCDPNLEKTIIVLKKVEDLESHKMFFSRVEQLMKSEEFKKKVSFPDSKDLGLGTEPIADNFLSLLKKKDTQHIAHNNVNNSYNLDEDMIFMKNQLKELMDKQNIMLKNQNIILENQTVMLKIINELHIKPTDNVIPDIAIEITE